AARSDTLPCLTSENPADGLGGFRTSPAMPSHYGPRRPNTPRDPTLRSRTASWRPRPLLSVLPSRFRQRNVADGNSDGRQKKTGQVSLPGRSFRSSSLERLADEDAAAVGRVEGQEAAQVAAVQPAQDADIRPTAGPGADNDF